MPVTIPAQLPSDIPALHELVHSLAMELARQNHRIEWLTRQMFGRKSEAHPTPGDGSQLSLLDVPEPAPAVPPADVPAAPPADAQKNKGHGRSRPSRELRRERIVHDLAPQQKSCPCCGGEMKCIGEEVTEQYEYMPSSAFVIEHVYPKYGCTDHCQQGVVQAPVPPAAIDGGLAGPGLLAHVITGKYCDHLPLHRQESILARLGLDLSRSTLCDWMMKCADVLAPVVVAMRREALQSFVLHSDETPIRMLERVKTRETRLWTYIGDDDHPYTLFDFTLTRGGGGPKAWLEGFKGHLVADGYAGYHEVYEAGATECACWAHIRRKFFDARSSDSVRTHMAINQIARLYAVEKEARHKTPDERKACRQAMSRPIVDAFYKWIADNRDLVLPKSPIGEALRYAANLETAARRFLDDGRLPIDNNVAERALRSPVVGRGNWLFFGNERGGRAAAVYFSLIHSARRHGVDPFAYLRDLLTRIPTHPQSRISELFPDKWASARRAQSASETPAPK